VYFRFTSTRDALLANKLLQILLATSTQKTLKRPQVKKHLRSPCETAAATGLVKRMQYWIGDGWMVRRIGGPYILLGLS
jgi:hypothetical protein